MTPAAGGTLPGEARKLLAEADIMLKVGLNDAVGRTAYLAGYHAARAFLFERLQKVFKTHSGVQSEFRRLTKDDPRLDPELRSFLSRAYNLRRSPITKPGLISHTLPPSSLSRPLDQSPARSLINPLHK